VAGGEVGDANGNDCFRALAPIGKKPRKAEATRTEGRVADIDEHPGSTRVVWLTRRGKTRRADEK
jgi:hypothetical protein